MGLSAQEIAQKWRNNTAAATASMEAGVNAVTEAPTEKAAQAADRMLAGIQRAVRDGKWQAGLRRVSLEGWKTAMREKAIPRIAVGVAAAEGNFANFMGEFMPHLQQLKARLASMPRGTLDQNIARMVETVRHNASFRRSRRS